MQTSLYGASKLAGEGLIAAYCDGFGFEGCIFRFVSILGERYTHGHVFDFYRSCAQDPTRLRVLGNGKQRKSYLYIGDCLDAMLLAMRPDRGEVQVFNLGTDRVLPRSTTRSAGSRNGSGVNADARIHRRRTRLDRRQPVHLSRLRKDPRVSGGRRS